VVPIAEEIEDREPRPVDDDRLSVDQRAVHGVILPEIDLWQACHLTEVGQMRDRICFDQVARINAESTAAVYLRWHYPLYSEQCDSTGICAH
jgi:hypothetical protein